MKKTGKVLKVIRRKIVEYITTNRLVISFVILNMIQTTLVRRLTIGNLNDFRPFLLDLAVILIIASIGYFFKPKRQFAYYFLWLLTISIMCIITSIYYTFYISFPSFALIITISLIGDVADSLFEKLRFIDFIYILAPILFYYIHRLLYKTNYYNYVAKIEQGKRMFFGTGIIGAILIAFTYSFMTMTDFSRLGSQWNREYVVGRFGILIYQGNDLIQTLALRFNSLFGYDVASQKFREFFAELATKPQATNEFTDIFKDKNVIFIHMESMQTFVMDLEFNGREVTPTLNQLAREGMFFSRFYPQISTGTSSDAEFTLLTSLMPVFSGTVFMNYFDREFVTIPNLLKEKGYYTFAMHGNRADMWNRGRTYPNLGYEVFFSQTSFDSNPSNQIGLGISDMAFFEQAMPMLEAIAREHERYMGKIITLTHHSSFNQVDKYGDFDLSYYGFRFNERTNQYEEIVDPFLEGSRMGNYMKSARYADEALGQFIEYIKESDYFNDTVFVFYGDHDAKHPRREFNFLYNYDLQLGRLLTAEDEGYMHFCAFMHELSKNTPLIIWTKDLELQQKIRGRHDYVMGMYDILPTLGNMMGFKSPYALGHDIFSIRENNIVIFPNGDFLTQNIYFRNSVNKYMSLGDNLVIEADFIERKQKYVQERLEVSNAIIVFDLIRREREKLEEES